MLLQDNPVSILSSAWLSPAASAVSADEELFRDFPATFMLAGSKEWYIDGVRELVRRMRISKVDLGRCEGPVSE